jgi:hypothetical protein
MFRKLSKKHLAAIAFVGALAITGVSVAYFTGGSGTITGSGTVGTSSPLAVTTNTPTWSGTLTALYPGATNDTELIPFTVTNNGNGHQAVTNVQISMPTEANGDAETAANLDIPGCKAAWFTAAADSGNGALPFDLAPSASYPFKVDLTMQNLSNTVQDACKGAAPAVTITAS